MPGCVYALLYYEDGRGEGAADYQLKVVAESEPGQFVETKRLEEDWPGYSWRSIFSPGFVRSLPAPTGTAHLSAGKCVSSLQCFVYFENHCFLALDLEIR